MILRTGSKIRCRMQDLMVRMVQKVQICVRLSMDVTLDCLVPFLSCLIQPFPFSNSLAISLCQLFLPLSLWHLASASSLLNHSCKKLIPTQQLWQPISHQLLSFLLFLCLFFKVPGVSLELDPSTCHSTGKQTKSITCVFCAMS